MNFPSLVGHITELAGLVETNNQPADRIVGNFLSTRKYLGSHDRRFISDFSYGLIRHRKRLKVLVSQYLGEHPSPALSRQGELLARFIAYSAAVEEIDPQTITTSLQEQWLKLVPDIGIGEFTGWLVRNKSLEFLPGSDTDQLAHWYSFEEWMVRKWVDQFGQDEAEDLLHALNAEAPVTLRVNRLKTSVEECRERLRKEGIETIGTRHAPAGLAAAKRFNAHASRAFKEGLFDLQDEGSQIVCSLTEAEQGMFVIDACAGAGGKALTIAMLMNNQGEILAFDIDRDRLAELERRARQSGVEIIVTQRTGQVHPGDLLGKASVVLVDAPCSGSGTIRRNPWLKWSITEPLLEEYAGKQYGILDSNASFVKRGGRLVYATCSLFREENEEVVEKFLSNHPEFQSQAPANLLTRLGLDQNGSSPYVKLLPHKHSTDGFFVAVLERKGWENEQHQGI